MANNYNVNYCLLHGREALFEWFKPFDGSEELYLHEILPGEFHHEEEYCSGPFTYCSPPPPLTEEEWEIILDREYSYAS